MGTFIEGTDRAFNTQLKSFANKLANYNTLLGISAAELTAIRADAIAFDYVMTNQETVQDFAHTYTNYHEQLRRGGSNTLGPLPLAPVFPAAPLMPGANIEARFRLLIQRITHATNYTLAIGQDLGIIAPVPDFNPDLGKPVFSITKIAGGHPVLVWKKGKFEGIDIFKDSGAGFVKLDRSTRPDYTDRSPLPAFGISAVWKYKMIYIYKDAEVGNYSDEATVTVVGEI